MAREIEAAGRDRRDTLIQTRPAIICPPANPASLRGPWRSFRQLASGILLGSALLTLPGDLGSAEFPAAENPTDPDSLIPDTPTVWSRTLNVRTSAGYNDNLRLNSSASEHSLALGAELEATLVRLPLDGRELLLHVTGNYTHYPDGERVDHEALLLGLAQLRLDLSSRWQAALDLQYFFLDQVIDTSITEANLSSAPVRGHGLTVRPSVRRDLPGNFWLELAAGATRQFFAEPFDDYWEGGPKLVLGREYGTRSSVSLSYEWKQRVHDTREEVAFDGTNITNVPGTELQFQIHELELALRHNWDEQRRWRTVTRLEFLANRDNGSGYFDYQRYQASQQLRYVAKNWEVKVQARVAYYDFSDQLGDPPDQDQRAKTVVGASLRGERRLAKHLKLFADYSFEKSLSNRATDEYHLNKVAGGIDYGF